MVLQWDDSLSWVKPDINTTLSQHTMNYKFDEISPVAYGNNEGKCYYNSQTTRIFLKLPNAERGAFTA